MIAEFVAILKFDLCKVAGQPEGAVILIRVLFHLIFVALARIWASQALLYETLNQLLVVSTTE